MEWCSV